MGHCSGIGDTASDEKLWEKTSNLKRRYGKNCGSIFYLK